MPSAPERKVAPLSLKEKAMVAGLVAVVIGAPLLGWWAYRAASAAETVVETFLEHLERGEGADAFALLDPALQRDVGGADALLARWKSARVSGLTLATGCSGVGGELVVVKMDARGSAGATFALGVPTGSCGKGEPLALHVNLRDGKVRALKLTL